MQDDQDSSHRKSLAQILRYIASMHTTLHDQDNLVFCQNLTRPERAEDFFADESEVLFTTESFRHLLSLQYGQDDFKSPPFTFYAAAGLSQKRSLQSLFQGGPAKTCWLRITRLTSSQIAPRPVISEKVRPYLKSWAESQGVRVEDLMTLGFLEEAPKLAPGSAHATKINQFVRRMKKHLRQKALLDLVEPVYNLLFEWQQQEHAELVWGLGHARMLQEDGTLVNGPLLEVLVEVELARDGALVLRPRDHTGVTLNRAVVAGLGGNSALVAQLYKDVAEMEPSHISPAQPTTYAKMLQRMAVELSPGGSYRNSQDNSVKDPTRLVVTEAWCVYQRTKPSSVWARDAMAFADQLSLQNESYSAQQMELPLATCALTSGPQSLDELVKSLVPKKSTLDRLMDVVTWGKNPNVSIDRPIFPLPTSEAQNRIAELLLQGQPAVVCEGPPGTGKSHSIANLICAYLCRGKRVLCTSKHAPALAVLRNRLPPTVQELCVDVSRSEQAGLQQLQVTVERLANRVACASAMLETEKCDFLKKSVAQYESQLAEIDAKLTKQSDKIHGLVNSEAGQEFVQCSLELVEDAPWLVTTMAEWKPHEVTSIRDRVASLIVPSGDSIRNVTGFSIPPSSAIISLVAAQAGNTISVAKNAIWSKIATVPVIGDVTGMAQSHTDLEEALGQIRLDGASPETLAEWKIVLRALEHSRALYTFEVDFWRVQEVAHGWPIRRFNAALDELVTVHELLNKAVHLKVLAWKLDVENEVQNAAECRALDVRRCMITNRLQGLAEDLVDATVLTELARSFSTEAQSALIRFAQIAGKAKFSRASQPSKMSQRQRRKRQEYLDAFDKCCRFIPCWVLTTSQISDYLPPECLFDLVILDEASQSDITALPGMLRGKQWLIVGDGKQVSPTESFVSEDQIEALRAALPASPMEDSLLPGQSFFDLCAQAFPKGRVVLSEHFRCAEEIIKFSNEQFYDGRLVPLRLPTKSERLTPSLVDIKVPNGEKVGKINEKEADEIVRLVQELTSGEQHSSTPRSIGVISLVGDDQSRLVRGRLLDAIGPHLMARHDILVGDPPSFQGAERDIIFLSMVCSPGAVPTQSQLMHVQRANVAMSRARDRCVLVRSIDIHEISNDTDVKIPIIEFFMAAGEASDDNLVNAYDAIASNSDAKQDVRRFLANLLRNHGYVVREMGVVWDGGISVEHVDSDKRAALFVDFAGESCQEWHASYCQQKAIERVGWNCLRVDSLSLLSNYRPCLRKVVQFLSSLGIETPVKEDEEPEEDQLDDSSNEPMVEDIPVNGSADEDSSDSDDGGAAEPSHDVIVVSSDDESTIGKSGSGANGSIKPEPITSERVETDVTVDPANFGQVVDMSFLGNTIDGDQKKRSIAGRGTLNGGSRDDSSSSPSQGNSKRSRRYRRLDKYSRDGRWYPGPNREPPHPEDEMDTEWDGIEEDYQREK